jgi:hypothetical protein
MENTNVELHKVYAAKVSGNVVPVRLDKANPHGGWDGTNMTTRKQVRVKTAGRLRGLWPQKTMPIVDAKPTADVGPTTTPPPAAKTKAKKEPKAPRLSLLNLAAEYLKSNAEGNCQQMVAHALSQGWKTSGKTPAATLSAAIGHEIKTKGTAARFQKMGRGTFALAKTQIVHV